MEKYIYSDLACENVGGKGDGGEDISENIKKITVRDIKNVRHALFLTPKLWLLGDGEFDTLRREIAEEIYVLIATKRNKEKPMSVLAVGLGNPQLTSDALGVETVKRLTYPRKGEKIDFYAVTPDVMGNTGVRTLLAVDAYVKLLKPSALIVVDALLAKSYERLASTVQISDGGIAPSGGIDPTAPTLSLDTLGVPVISIGVPTAVNSSTLIAEALKKGGMNDLPDGVSRLLDNSLNFFVTPKEADILLRCASLLLSSAVDLALTRLAWA